MIVSTRGTAASSLGLAAHPEQDPRCIGRAFEAGINFHFFYGPGHTIFVNALKPLVRGRRADLILASGSGARTKSGLRTARRKIFSAVGAEMIDIFFAEYVNPGDNEQAIFGQGGVLDELNHWKVEGLIRYVGASAHNRALARRLATDGRVDVLMHRYNMAHRKAATEVFPAALENQTPVVGFTATRWSTLLRPPAEWAGPAPAAADCYRFCLAQRAVKIVLTAPQTVDELMANLEVVNSPAMDGKSSQRWEKYGDFVDNHDRGRDHDYESRWP
jgi:aryl-alcohol dehydrogenase-like predicted oxidoreductase